MAVLWARWSLVARAEATPEVRIRNDAVAVDARAMTFGLDLSLRARLGDAFELEPYIGGGTAVFRAAGVGFERNLTATQAVLRLRVGSLVGATLGPVFLGARAELNGSPAATFRSTSGLGVASTRLLGAEFGFVAAVRLGLRPPRGAD